MKSKFATVCGQNKYSGIAQTMDYRKVQTTEGILEVF